MCLETYKLGLWQRQLVILAWEIKTTIKNKIINVWENIFTIIGNSLLFFLVIEKVPSYFSSFELEMVPRFNEIDLKSIKCDYHSPQSTN